MKDDPRTRSFGFQLNGETVQVEDVPPQTTLLDFIRSRNLTGAKEGCAEGECGACALALVKQGDSGSAYQVVNSCLMFLPMVAGQEVYTVESLGSPESLHPVQKAIAEGAGSQCGFCTPGFTMSLFAEQYRPGRAEACRIAALGGNLCRCTGYRPIRDAALSLGPPPDDKFKDRLTTPAPLVSQLHYENEAGTFYRPTCISECLAILQKVPDSRIVAGNTDLGVESNLKYQRYPCLVSVEALPELRVFRETAESVEIGAGLSLDEIESRWSEAPQVVRDWFELFASPLIRNRATLGGNLATASPIGDAAPLLLGLDAHVTLLSGSGLRTVALDAFFTGYRRTVMARDEVMVSVIVPKPYPTMTRFYKVAKRRLDDISTVAACFAISLDRAQRVQEARIALGGVAAIPTRVKQAEEALLGRHWNAATIRRAQDAIEQVLSPLSDHRGSAEYRLAMAQSLLEKFLFEMQEVAA